MKNEPGVSPDSHESIARDIGAVTRISAVPSILQMICDETGMGFAAVARVTDATWTACAVLDNVDFGLKPGGQLELKTTLCFESRALNAPIVIDQFSQDATYRGHHTGQIYGLESYISIPIVLPNGSYFGNLCAIDSRPAKVSEPRIVRMFEVFAQLIGMQLDNELRLWSADAMLRKEKETAGLREQFIAVLCHDLRNPLSTVNATAEWLVRRPSEPEVVAAGQRLRRTVSRMTGLIGDMMDFARGQFGAGIAMSIETVELLDTHLFAVVDELIVANPTRVIVSDISVAPSVQVDLRRMQQLLSNLLGNALTHGAQDQPIRVDVSHVQDILSISVTNGGNPIPEHLLPRLFEPYWRSPGSQLGGGLGLGLFICHQIAIAHGGTLEVRSSLEGGTTFCARLPAMQTVVKAQVD